MELICGTHFCVGIPPIIAFYYEIETKIMPSQIDGEFFV